jgi:hypothetical protein
MAQLYLLLVVLATVVSAADPKTASCYTNGTHMKIEDNVIDTNAAAWATYIPSINETGWDKLHIHTNESYGDEHSLFCAGVLEGYLTREHIRQHFDLFKIGVLADMQSDDWPPVLVDWFTKSLNWWKSKTSGQTLPDYWVHMRNILEQFKGLVSGFNVDLPADQQLTELDFYALQAAGDLDDLEVVWALKKDPSFVPSDDWYDTHHHCTGMVRMMPDMSDVYFSQDTWSGYTSLHRTLKEYDFPLKTPGSLMRKVIFSSYPGSLISGDDFYVTDTNLLVLETTMHLWNTSIYEFTTPETLLMWPRMIYALRTSDNGQQWGQQFLRENSGTYNNEYFIVDLKRFTPGSVPKAGFMWIVEQYPGPYVESRDSTDALLGEGFLPSINTPRWPDLYEAAGYPEKIKSLGPHGSYWSFNDSSRMHITQRDMPDVNDYEAFQHFMRYNKWQTDPFSHDDPAQSILSRYDLRTAAAWGNAACFGGLDSKTVKYSDAMLMQFDAISSPTYESQTPFRFDFGPCADARHDGLPNEWKFDWIKFKTE